MRWSLATVALLPRGASAHSDDVQQRQTIEWAARAGFEGIEVSPQWLNIDDLRPSELRRFARNVESAGLEVSGVNVNRCLFTRGRSSGQALLRIRRAIGACGELGANLLTLSLSMPLPFSECAPIRGIDFPESERSAAASVLSVIADEAANAGVNLSLELHDGGLLDTAEWCLDMVRRVGAPNIGVNPDLGNFVRSNPGEANWVNELQKLAPQANNWHVKNYRDGATATLWDGDIDYLEAMRMMRAAGYHGWVSVESYATDAHDLQERSLAYLRQLCRELTASSKGQESAA